MSNQSSENPISRTLTEHIKPQKQNFNKKLSNIYSLDTLKKILIQQDTREPIIIAGIFLFSHHKVY